MMGLLDPTDDPRTMGLLSLGMGLLGSKGSFGNALSQAGPQALQAMQQVKDRQRQAEQDKQRQAMQALQMQQAQAAMLQQQQAQQQAQQAQQRQAAIEGAYRGAIGAGQDGAPQVDQASLIRSLTQADPMAAYQMLQPKSADYKVVGDALVSVGPQGVKEAYRAPSKPESKPEIVKILGLLHGEGTPAFMQALRQYQVKATTHAPSSTTNVSYGAPVAGVDASGNPVFFQPDKMGGAPAIVPGVTPPKNDKPMTEAQAKAATFKSQMESAEKELSGIPVDMSKAWNQADVAIAGGLTNIGASPVAQRVRQAQDQWSESFLRFKTGAAATIDEVRLNNRTFFPQPGDSKPVIEQKQRMRQQAIQDIGVAASGNPPDHSAGKPRAASDPLGIRGGK